MVKSPCLVASVFQWVSGEGKTVRAWWGEPQASSALVIKSPICPASSLSTALHSDCVLMAASLLAWLYSFVEFEDPFGTYFDSNLNLTSSGPAKPSYCLSHDAHRSKSTIFKEQHLCLARPTTLCWVLPWQSAPAGMGSEWLVCEWSGPFLQPQVPQHEVYVFGCVPLPPPSCLYLDYSLSQGLLSQSLFTAPIFTHSTHSSSAASQKSLPG